MNVRRNLGATPTKIQTANAALINQIRQAIRARGPVPFAWFMEQALYHPEDGYYSSGRCVIGRAGDYFTNVSVGPLFGRLLAAQFGEMWEALGKPHEFRIVEQGAHGGEFAFDVLQALRHDHAALFAAARYEIVEPFSVLRERQRDALAEFEDNVCWTSVLAELAPFCGVHFSNELIDAMPVHVVRWTGAEWLERHVTEQAGTFAFIDLPLSNPELAQRLRGLPAKLPVGYETEVNLAASTWIDSVAKKCERGFVVAVDYGFSRDEFYAPHRTTGTLQSYAKHRVVASPLARVGEADITAHVEWTSVIEQAQRSGLTFLGFADQHHFITGLLAGAMKEQFSAPTDSKTNRALQTLLHPGLLGMKFQFLVLGNNVDPANRLSGLQFARMTPGEITVAPQT